VTVIDPHTYKVIGTVSAGTDPQHVAPSWNMQHLYVDNDAGNSLTEIDPATGKKTRTIPVRDPYNLYFTPDGTKAIVVAERFQSLDFRNPKTWNLIKSVPIPEAGVDHLDFSANGRSLMVSCEFSGWLYRVSTESMKVTGRIDLGGLPVDVKLSPDGRYFYVTNQGTNGVSVVDAREMKVVRFIPTGDGAHGLAISRNTRRLYVSNRYAGTISVISFSKMKKVATWHVGGSPDMLQVSPNGRELWTANRFDGTVSVIETHSGSVTHTIPVGSRPHGLAYFPQPGNYSVGHNGVYR
jgi:YVTN family beta-propeller protein